MNSRGGHWAENMHPLNMAKVRGDNPLERWCQVGITKSGRYGERH